MSTHNICFRGGIRKYFPVTRSYLELRDLDQSFNHDTFDSVIMMFSLCIIDSTNGDICLCH